MKTVLSVSKGSQMGQMNIFLFLLKLEQFEINELKYHFLKYKCVIQKQSDQKIVPNMNSEVEGVG